MAAEETGERKRGGDFSPRAHPVLQYFKLRGYQTMKWVKGTKQAQEAHITGQNHAPDEIDFELEVPHHQYAIKPKCYATACFLQLCAQNEAKASVM